MMRRYSPFALVRFPMLSVVIMQSAKLQAASSNRAHQVDDFCSVALLDSGPVHARIYVEKNSQRAAAPLLQLLRVLGQNGNAHARKLLRDLLYSSCSCGHGWISQEHIRRTAIESHQQLPCGRTLEIADASLDPPPHRVAKI